MAGARLCGRRISPPPCPVPMWRCPLNLSPWPLGRTRVCALPLGAGLVHPDAAKPQKGPARSTCSAALQGSTVCRVGLLPFTYPDSVRVQNPSGHREGSIFPSPAPQHPPAASAPREQGSAFALTRLQAGRDHALRNKVRVESSPPPTALSIPDAVPQRTTEGRAGRFKGRAAYSAGRVRGFRVCFRKTDSWGPASSNKAKSYSKIGIP